MALKRKRDGLGLDMRTFRSKEGSSYLVFRTAKGSYHAFREVEAKEASRECGASTEGTTRQMWASLWDK
jgi:hypothetical protein